MTITINKIALIGVLVAALGLFLASMPHVEASASPGLPATLATSSLQVVGPLSVNRLFATSTCSSRVITTFANPIMLSFGALSSTTVSGTNGHLQPASTTVTYDSGLYGCGLWSAYGYTGSTSISLSEFQ